MEDIDVKTYNQKHYELKALILACHDEFKPLEQTNVLIFI